MKELHDLDKLERDSVYILREAKARFRNIACLWSMGKDSTVMLKLCQKAFFGKVPFPVIHIDNGLDFPETYEYRRKLADEWGLDLVVGKSVIGDNVADVKCCGSNKTDALKKLVDEYGFDALIVSIRRDEHGVRRKERVFSPRDDKWCWMYWNQDAEPWGYSGAFVGHSHVRVHPLLKWREIDAWAYVKKEGIPVHPLYFSRDGQRYRSLGCTECTVGFRSEARTVDEIIEELKRTDEDERSGRLQDKENVMQRLRALGYM